MLLFLVRQQSLLQHSTGDEKDGRRCKKIGPSSHRHQNDVDQGSDQGVIIRLDPLDCVELPASLSCSDHDQEVCAG